MSVRRSRAILFDLDDTLFDCNSQLVLPGHREAVAAMIAAGLPAKPDEALRRRLDLFVRQPREDINELLAESYGVNRPEIREAGYRAFHEREVGPIRPDEGVSEMLDRLRESFLLFLVTSGNPATQAEKVRRLGLDGSFDQIVYVDPSRGETKEGAFRTILEERRLEPAACIAVGNRVDSEIRAAVSLKIRAIWLRRGEYAHLEPEGAEETPDHTILSIGELPPLLGTG
ncbi:MAG: HAD hydrolase-like protein [Planctomycetota bacterium]|nr:HAD hydrolase-like protein [Planctomycetota bacterium]